MKNIDIDVKTVLLQQEREAREIQEVKECLNKILSAVVNRDDIPEWLTLEQAVKLKGGNSLNTVKCNNWLKPGAGSPRFSRICGGRTVYHRDSVIIPWLSVTDENRRDYILHTCGITNIPVDLERKLLKAEQRMGGENA